jgi:hypothetical protein
MSKKRNYFGICLRVIAAMLICALIGTGLAKYLSRDNTNGAVLAKEFYFTSDMLDGKEHTLPAGTTSVSFAVGNHPDKLRYSTVDITCTATVDGDSGASVTVDDGDNNILSSGNPNDKTYTLNGLTEGGTYTVTVTGSSASGTETGYKKTLTATFTVEKPVVYKYLDTSNSGYVLLTVWSQGYKGTVAIKYTGDATLVPDNTDSVMRDVNSNSIQFEDTEETSYWSHTYRFFGDGSNISVENFAVTYNGDTATAKTPQ